MLRHIFFLLLTFIIILGGGLGGGLGSVEYALRFMRDFSPIIIGSWHAYPHSGTLQADPYARARAAKFKHLALGSAEGLSFYLWQDNQGRPLKGTCSYFLEGKLPTAQFFTLYAIGSNLVPRRSQQGRPDILTSYNTVQTAKGSYFFTISPHAQSGNWLASEGGDAYGLILTLYNSPIRVATGLTSPNMPHLTREGNC